MKDHVRALVRNMDALVGRNVLREYLQARVLEGLQRAGAMGVLAFQGGTALRFLYDLPRYSEDLDFALEGAREAYDLRRWIEAMTRQFRREQYAIRTSLRERGSVHSAWVRFSGILYETGLSPHRDEVLAVKVDVDTRPPKGAVTETRLVRRHVPLRLHHHDRGSLFAGKLHALLRRPWTKGRDVYDLVWYLSDPAWPAPNLRLLNSALAQSDAGTIPLTRDGWRRAVLQRLTAISWSGVSADVRPFLEREQEMANREDVMALLRAT